VRSGCGAARSAFQGVRRAPSRARTTESCVRIKHRGDTHTLLTQIAPCALPQEGTIRVVYVFDNGDTDAAEVEVISAATLESRKWESE
jgi:hypothetical protein